MKKDKLDKDFIEASKLLDNGNYKKALKLFLKLYKHGHKDIYLNIGYIYEKLNKIKKAKYWYKKGISKNKDFTCMTNLAILYREEYKFKKAKKWFLEALSLNDVDAGLELAKLYLSEAKINKAKEYLSKVLDGIPYENVTLESVNIAKKLMYRLDKRLSKNIKIIG